MHEEELPPTTPVIRPPDLAQPSMPPPMAGIEPGKAPGPSGVNVRVREAEAAAESEPEAGSIAPFNSRIIAAVIDVAVMIGLQIAVSMILPHFAAKIAWLVGLAYLVTRDSLPFLGGQSVGKKAMKLKAVTLEGKALTGNWEPALIRNGVLLIPLFGFIEFIILLTREGKPEHGRRLGDEWAKTKVILAPDPPAAG